MPNLYDWDAFQYKAGEGAGFGDGSCDTPNVVSGLSLDYAYEVNLAHGHGNGLTTGPSIL